ncbi:MAG: (R)-1-hydroxy-2-trimethylaminoethylphosphonate oxygenase [Paracoccaceae bacterium]|jgi:predicted HD phosphohydrolase|nr:HD domain-containing protein [Paracoccaceae bacterium]|tara:strand:+ start:2232 stop:2825 length:594 start_codon:yes stop_codon:yes gene_type:complete
MKHSVTDLNATNIVDFIGSIFEKRGDEEYLGEPVTMGQHMLQGATMAEKSREPDEIIIGTLLHDIGHFTSEFGTFSMEDTEDRYHEDAGAAVLEQFFPKIITDCCRHHVAAKRYLCATDPEYFQKLSTASIHSLNLQGGPMSEAELKDFEKNPNLKKILKVRLYDDAGKIPDMITPSFWHFAPLVQKMVDSHSSKEK